ncbi:MAG: hypothetical protein NTX40_00885 [Planctomycetota bacterium]|nr:hypothetical protein [Planctomycetota bacterium]
MSQFLRSCILGFAITLITLVMVSLIGAQTPPKPVSGPPEAPALPADIPGGIVYLEAGNAVYQDLATGQKTNLTADIPEFQPKGPWAISENGRWLCWFGDGTFVARDLFAKNNVNAGVEPCSGLGSPAIKFLPDAASFKNLTVSPDTERCQIAFESVIKGSSFVQIKRTTTFKQVPDTFDGIVRVDTENKNVSCYGNNNFWYPTRMPCMLESDWTSRDKMVSWPAAGDPDSDEDALTMDPGTQVSPQLLMKKNVYFPAWQKASSFSNGEGMLAFVYKTEGGWGPIEIRRCRASKFGDLAVDALSFVFDPKSRKYVIMKGKPKPHFWRLQISVKNFGGLAWRPNGSLSYLSDNKIFIIDKKQIENGIRKSAVIAYVITFPKAVDPVGTGAPRVKTANTAFPASPASFARGIKGGRIHWVSDETFLFQGGDKSLYSCTKGTTAKVLESIPAEFFYCSGIQVASTNPTSPPAEVASGTLQENEIRRAVEWATGEFEQAQGKTLGPEWEYYEGCQKFVANAYGKPCPFYSYATAAEGAQKLNAEIEMNKGRTPPRGSWVFYTCKTDPRGHVALAVGDGFVIHASTNMAKKVATVRKDKYDDVQGADYIGWAWPQRKK